MEVNLMHFRTNCLKFIEDVHILHTEIIITEHGKPLAKLISIPELSPVQFLGALTGVGKTVGDLTEPFDDEWEVD